MPLHIEADRLHRFTHDDVSGILRLYIDRQNTIADFELNPLFDLVGA
jgi:hypothetical protein